MKSSKKSQVTDKEKFKAEGISWMIRNNLAHQPAVQQTIVQNVERSSIFIESMELLTDLKNYKFLIFLKISLLGKILKRKRGIAENTVSLIQEAFPKWSVKVILSEALWKKEIEALKGKKE